MLEKPSSYYKYKRRLKHMQNIINYTADIKRIIYKKYNRELSLPYNISNTMSRNSPKNRFKVQNLTTIIHMKNAKNVNKLLKTQFRPRNRDFRITMRCHPEFNETKSNKKARFNTTIYK